MPSYAKRTAHVRATGQHTCSSQQAIGYQGWNPICLLPGIMGRQDHLLRLVDDFHQRLALLVDAAVQEAAALDGKRQSAADVGLERVGRMPVKGHRGTVWGLLPANTSIRMSISWSGNAPAQFFGSKLGWDLHIDSEQNIFSKLTSLQSSMRTAYTAAQYKKHGGSPSPLYPGLLGDESLYSHVHACKKSWCY